MKLIIHEITNKIITNFDQEQIFKHLNLLGGNNQIAMGERKKS